MMEIALLPTTTQPPFSSSVQQDTNNNNNNNNNINTMNVTEEKPKPTRPLSAYNLFFQAERRNMLEVLPVRAKGKPRHSHGKIGFADLARKIGANWKTITAEERLPFDERAAVEKKRYAREMKEWKRAQEEARRATRREHELLLQSRTAAANGIEDQIRTVESEIAARTGVVPDLHAARATAFQGDPFNMGDSTPATLQPQLGNLETWNLPNQTGYQQPNFFSEDVHRAFNQDYGRQNQALAVGRGNYGVGMQLAPNQFNTSYGDNGNSGSLQQATQMDLLRRFNNFNNPALATQLSLQQSALQFSPNPMQSILDSQRNNVYESNGLAMHNHQGGYDQQLNRGMIGADQGWDDSLTGGADNAEQGASSSAGNDPRRSGMLYPPEANNSSDDMARLWKNQYS